MVSSADFPKTDITIVVATLNAATHLGDALSSIGAELENCYLAGYSAEVLIADGGSDDETLEIAKRFDFINILPGTDTSLYNGFNRGIAAARGAAITFINSDDMVLQDGLIKALNALNEKPYIGWTSSDIVQGATLENTAALRRDCPMNLESALFGIPAINGLVIRKTTFDQVGLFNDTIGLSADRLLMIELARSGLTGHQIDGPSYFYRLHDGSLTGSSDGNARARIFKAELAMADYLARHTSSWPKGQQKCIEAHRVAWTARNHLQQQQWLALGRLVFSGGLTNAIAAWRRWRGRLTGW